MNKRHLVVITSSAIILCMATSRVCAQPTASLYSYPHPSRVADVGTEFNKSDQPAQSHKKSVMQHIKAGGKFDSAIGVLASKQKSTSAMFKPKPRSNHLIRLDEERGVQVYITLNSTDEHDLAELSALGVELEVTNSQLKMVQGWIDMSLLESLAELDNVVGIRRPIYGQSNRGSVNTQGDAIVKANQLRAQGLLGKGVKVGIVSDGYEGWTQARNSGDLPQNLTRYGACQTSESDPANCRSGSACNEGTAMAEIIHDIAPEAELAIAAVNTSLEFIEQINRLATEFEADIIVDDLGFFGEPYFYDGPIAKAVSALPSKILYVSSAGNSATAHYYRPRVRGSDYSTYGRLVDFSTDDGITRMPQDLFHGFLVPPRSSVVVIMQWDHRPETYYSREADYAIDIYSQTAELIDSSDIDNIATRDFFEAVCLYNPRSTEDLRFLTVPDVGGPPFKMFFLGASAIEHPIAQGSIFGHPSVSRALAVGSINANEPGHDDIAFYSSQGPSAFNGPNPDFLGRIISQPRKKPDLVAIDGVRVTGAAGFPQQFFGTSAAAPHVAGVAAQLMSVSPLVNADSVKRALTQGAIDLGTPGYDFVYGYGLLDAARAREALKIPLPPINLLLLDD